MAGIEEYRAKDLMTENLITAKANQTVSDAIGLMKKHRVSEILIDDEKGDVKGIVNYEMFTKRRHLPFSTKLENVMHSPPSVNNESDVSQICELLLSSGYRGIPVKNVNGDYVGIISRTDIVRIVPELEELKQLTVEEVMTPNPSTIKEHDSVDQAKLLMNNMDEQVLPVVDDDTRLTGMIGIRDIVNNTLRPMSREEQGELRGEKVSPYDDLEIRSIMSSPPVTIDVTDKLTDAAKKMAQHDISTLVALEDGEIKGILTAVDIIETLASFKEDEQVYVQITGLEEGPDTLEMMYDLIQKYLQKYNNVVKPLVMNIHVITHNKEGNETKYSLRLRLQSDHGMFYVKEHDWNMMRALDDGLENMRRIIFEEKEKRLDQMRKHPKYRGR